MVRESAGVMKAFMMGWNVREMGEGEDCGGRGGGRDVACVDEVRNWGCGQQGATRHAIWQMVGMCTIRTIEERGFL